MFDWTLNTEAVVRRCSSKQLLLKLSQISQESTCVGVSFNKVVGLKVCSFMKKRFQRRCFPVKFTKVLRTPFLQNTSSGCFCKLPDKKLDMKTEMWKLKRTTNISKMSFSANLYMLKVNNGNIRTMCEIYSKLIIKTPERLFTAQKITFSIKFLFSKCDQIRRFLRIWSHLLKRSPKINFIRSG